MYYAYLDEGKSARAVSKDVGEHVWSEGKQTQTDTIFTNDIFYTEIAIK